MNNHYLEILELKPGASKIDVKNAYRRLSKKYHPDISKDPEAKEKFIDINEAYNFLSKVGPRPKNESTSYNYDTEVTEYDSWRATARKQAKQRAYDQWQLQQELTKKILKGFDSFALLILVFNFLLIVDYILPRQSHEQSILEVSMKNEGKNRHRYDKVSFTDFNMLFDEGEILRLRSYEKALVVTTPILDNPISALITAKGETTEHFQIYSVYRVFWVIIPGLLILLMMYQYLYPKLDTKLSLAIFILMGFIFQLYLFFQI